MPSSPLGFRCPTPCWVIQAQFADHVQVLLFEAHEVDIHSLAVRHNECGHMSFTLARSNQGPGERFSIVNAAHDAEIGWVDIALPPHCAANRDSLNLDQ